MIKYTESKPQCSYLKLRVSTCQATSMKFVMHRYLILRWGDGILHNRYLFLLRHFDISSVLLFSSPFGLALPITDFSVKQSAHLPEPLL